jgi:hypothetical protein
MSRGRWCDTSAIAEEDEPHLIGTALKAATT